MRWSWAMICVIWPSCAFAATLIENSFQSGTEGWTVGTPSMVRPELNLGDGPAGASDAFLITRSIGIPGPGGRLAVFNETSGWLGNYLELGISAIEADLRNFSDRAVSIRFAIEGQSVSNVVHRAVSAEAAVLPAFSQWTGVRWNIGPGELVAVRTTDDPMVALRHVTQVRLIHNPEVAFAGVVFSGGLGIDNLRAIPEPKGSALILLGVFLLLGRSRES